MLDVRGVLEVRVSLLLSRFTLQLYRRSAALSFRDVSRVRCLVVADWRLATEELTTPEVDTLHRFSCRWARAGARPDNHGTGHPRGVEHLVPLDVTEQQAHFARLALVDADR